MMSQTNEASVKLQMNIKNNSLELQDYITDLHKWEKDIKDQEKQLSPSHDILPQDMPPVRCRKPEIVTEKIITDSKRRKGDVKPNTKKERISSSDYSAWDKFDVDKALDSASSEEEAPPSQENLKNQTSISNSANTTPSLKKKERAAKLKDEGNKCYSKGQLEYAVAKYTQGIALDPTNSILPANRAMAYIKLEKYEAAEADCDRCLKFDDKYIKAYLRRGTSRLKLKKLKLAIEDFKKVLELEPWNKDAKKELEKLESTTEWQTSDSGAEAQMKQTGVDKAISHHKKKTSNQSESEKSKLKERDTYLDSQKISEVLTKTSTKANDSKTKIDHGKKIKIVEIDSSQNQLKESSSDDLETVTPIVKLPHQRSQKLMNRVQVVDVPSEKHIPGELPSSSVSEASEMVHCLKSSAKDVPVPIKSRSKANKHIQNTEKSMEKSASSMPPPVPRTSHQFTQDWQKVARHQAHAVDYIKAIPPTFFQGLDLESELLMDLISALNWDDFNSEQAVSYLSALTKSVGFGVNIMFLDSNQKKAIHEVIAKCKEQEKLHHDFLIKLERSLL